MTKYYPENIKQSGLTIFDKLDPSNEDLWIPTDALAEVLQPMIGLSLRDLPLKTRSKVAKSAICEALGYPVPKSFKRSIRPNFPGQNLDVYMQKSTNLQIWNEELDTERRYAIFKIAVNDSVETVRVITGAELEVLDTTGTLTQKYQARLETNADTFELISSADTERVSQVVTSEYTPSSESPVDFPQGGQLLPISEVMDRLKPLVGERFKDSGIVSERTRGGVLHEMISMALGYSDSRDNGQFPDIRHQLLEVKLQSSPTIDLGLVCPDSEGELKMPYLSGKAIRHCDVRYALFYANIVDVQVNLTHLFLVTGQDFFSRFNRFEGNVTNKKLQISLPRNFFDGQTESSQQSLL